MLIFLHFTSSGEAEVPVKCGELLISIAVPSVKKNKKIYFIIL